MNAAGTYPLTDTVNLKFQVYDPSGTCLLYEENDNNINLATTSGNVAVRIGSLPGNAKRGANDPGLDLATIFKNTMTLIAGANCPGGYSAAAGDARLLRVTVTDVNTSSTTQLAPDQVISSTPYAIVAETLQGIGPSGLIQVTGSVTQANVAALFTNATDASLNGWHNHDSRYARIGNVNNNFGTGDLYTTGKIGVGTASPNADIDIERAGSASMRIGSSTNTGNQTTLQFYGNGATRAAISSLDNGNVLNFSTGGTQALQLDSNQNAIFSKSVSVTGTLGLGQYSAAQIGTTGTPGTLLFSLNGLGAAAKGTMWVNTTTNTLEYWDGAAAQDVANVAGTLSSTLASGKIYVGNGSNVGTAVSMTGDATLSNTGALTLANSSVTGQPLTGFAVGANSAITATDSILSAFGKVQGQIAAASSSSSNAILKDGSVTYTGNQSFGGYNISNVGNFASTNASVNTATITTANIGTLNAVNGIFTNSTATVSPLVLKGAAAQSADLLDVLNSSGSILYSLNPLGSPTITTDLTTEGYVASTLTTSGANYIRKDGTVTYVGNQSFGGFDATNVGTLTAATVNGTSVNGTLGTFTTVNSSNVNATGSVSAASVTATGAVQGNSVVIKDSGSANKITITAPSLAANVAMILPANTGSANQYLKTDGAGNLSWSNTPAGFADPTTTQGDIIYHAAGGTTRMALGSTGQLAMSNGTDLTYNSLTGDVASVSGTGSVTLSNNVVKKNANNIFSVGNQEIDAAAATEIPLTLKGASSQSADLFDIKNSLGSLLVYVDSVGKLHGDGSQLSNLPSGVPSLTNGSVVFSGGGATLSQDNSNFYYDSTNHFLGIGTSTPVVSLDVRGDVAVQPNNSLWLYAAEGARIIRTGGLFQITSPQASLVFNVGTSERGRFDQATGNFGLGTGNPLAQLHTVANTDTVAGEIIQAHSATQSADMLDVENSNGTKQVWIDSNFVLHGNGSGLTGLTATPNFSGFTTGGAMIATSSSAIGQDASNFFWDNTNHRLGIGSTAPGGQLEVDSTAPAAVGIIVKGAASQTADLQDWKNNAGAIVASLSSSGTTLSLDQTQIGQATITAQSNLQLVANNNGSLILDTSANNGFVNVNTNQNLSVNSRNTNANTIVFQVNNGNYPIVGLDQDVMLLGHSTITSNPTFTLKGDHDNGAGYYPSNIALSGGDSAVGTAGGNVFIYGGTGSTNGNTILAHNGTIPLGSVGVGVTNPLAKLHVATTAATIGEIIQAAPSQSSDLVEVQDSNGTKQVYVDSNYVLHGNGSGLTGLTATPNFSGFTPGGAMIATSASAIGQDATSFFYDSTNHRLGLGTTSPGAALDVAGNVGGYSAFFGATGNASKIGFRRSSDGSTQGQIGYASPSESSEFQIVSNGGSGFLTLWTGGGEHARLLSSGLLGLGTTTVNAQFDAVTNNDATVGEIIQGHSATQAADLFQTQTAGGTVLLHIDAVGNLGLVAVTADPTGLGAGDKGKVWYRSDTNEIRYWNGSATKVLGTAGAGIQTLNGDGTNGQIIAAGSNIAVSDSGATHTIAATGVVTQDGLQQLTGDWQVGGANNIFNAKAIGVGETALSANAQRFEVPWQSGDTKNTAYFGGNNASNNQVAIMAESGGTTAISGRTNASSWAYGVFGYNTGNGGGPGVEGESFHSDGVRGLADSGGNGISGFSQSGNSGFFEAKSGSNTAATLVVQQLTGQANSIDMFQVQNSTGSVVAHIDASGKYYGDGSQLSNLPSGVPSLTNGSVVYSGGGSTLSQDNSNFYYDSTNHRLGIGTTAPGAPLHVYQASNNAAFIVEQNAGGRKMVIDSSGMSFNTTGTFGSNSWGNQAELEVYGPAGLGSREGVFFKGVTGQTGDAFHYSDVNNNTMASITAAGGGYFSGSVAIGTTSGTAQLQTVASTDTTTAVIVQAHSATQSADLWQVQNSAGTKQLYVDSNYVLHGNGSGLTGISGALSGLTAGGVPYATGATTIATDAANLFWDSSNHRLGLGTTAPNEQLELTGSIRLPATSATAGMIKQAGTPVLQTYGTNNFFAGAGAANLTLTPASATDNVAVGSAAMNSLTTGSRNIALGSNAGTQISAGSDNIAIGYDTIAGAPGSQNIAIGSYALNAANTTTSGVVAIGQQALENNTHALNTAVGGLAAQNNTSGGALTAVGYRALQQNTTGNFNVALGYLALNLNQTGTQNVGLGTFSLQNTIGNYNTGVGNGAAVNNTTGNNNTAVGYGSMNWMSTGNDNFSAGFESMYSSSGNGTGNQNTAAGNYALTNITSGSANVALGYQAGVTSTSANAVSTGSSNTFVGYNSGPGTPTQLNNASAFGANALVSASNAIVLGATGANRVNVGIGTTTPQAALHINTDSNSANGLIIQSNSSSQAADLLEVQDQNGTKQLYVDSSYVLHGNGSGLTGLTASAPGSSKQIPFNNGSGAFAAAATSTDFTIDDTNHLMTLSSSTPTGDAFVVPANPKTSGSNSLVRLGTSDLTAARANANGTYLGIVGNGTADLLNFQISGNSVFQVTSSGAVGVNMDANGLASMFDVSALGSGLASRLETSSSAVAPVLRLENDPGSPTVGSGPALIFAGLTSLTTGAPMTQISSVWTNVTNGSQSADITFSNENSAVMNETMRIKSNGNVGIGTTSPAAQLHTVASTDTAVAVAIQAHSATQSADLWDVLNSTGTTKLAWVDNAGVYHGNGTGLTGITATPNFSGFTTGGAMIATSSSTIGQDVSNFFWDSTNHRLGIGTTSPTTNLDVNGSANVNSTYFVSGFGSSAYFNGVSLALTNGGGVNITNTNAASGTNMRIEGGGNANSFLALKSTTAAGTSDYIKFQVGNNGATEAMRITDNGYVGIGNTNPAGMLNVGNASGAAGPTNATFWLSGNNGGGGNVRQWSFNVGSTSTSTSGYNDDRLRIRDETLGAERMTIDASGNVGIGTSAPAAQLHTLASNDTTTAVIVQAHSPTQSADLWQVQNSSGTKQLWIDNSYVLHGNGSGLTGITATPNFSGFTSGGAMIATSSSTIGQDAANFFWDSTNHRLGLGTTAPSDQLTLTGNINLPTTSSTAGQINQGSSTIVHTYGTNNFFAGASAGNFTLNTGSAAADVAIGNSALTNLTTGSSNVAIGNQASLVNTSGSANVAVGSLALKNNDIWGNNSAVGYAALLHATSSNNTGVGANALNYDNTGGNNTAVGASAGYGSATNAVTTGTNNTFVGYNAAPGTATQLSYAGAFGSGATVNSSNAFALGGTTTTNAVSVGIGTAAPGAIMHVNNVLGVNNVGEIIQAIASQSADLLEVQNSAGTKQLWIDNSYILHGNGSGLTGVTAAPNFSGFTPGGAMIATSSTAIGQDAANFFWDSSNHRLGLGTTSPSRNLSFTGQAAQSFGMEREVTAATAGNNLNINAGGATTGGTNLNGGNLIISSGVATGSGSSNIQFQVPQYFPASGTTDTPMLTTFEVVPGGAAVGSYAVPANFSTTGTAAINQPFNGFASGAILALRNDRAGNQTQTNDELGEVQFVGEDSGWSGFVAGIIKTTAPSVTHNAVNGTMSLQTLVSGNMADRITISGGYVGIGNTSPTAQLHALASTDTAVVAAIQAHSATQAADLLEVQDANGTKRLFVDSSYVLHGNGSGLTGVTATPNFTGFTAGGAMIATSSSAIGQDAANYFYDSSNHRLGLGTTNPAGIFDVEGGTSAANTNATNINIVAQNAGGASGTNTGGTIYMTAGSSNNHTTSQTLDGMVIVSQPNSCAQINLEPFSAPGLDFAILQSAPNTASGACAGTRALSLNPNGAPVAIGMGSASPTASFEVLGSGGVILNAGNVGIGTVSPSGQLHTVASTATTIGDIIQAAPAQSADLLEVQDSNGTKQVYIDSGYVLHGNGSGLTNINAGAITNVVTQDGLSPLTGDWNVGGKNILNAKQISVGSTVTTQARFYVPWISGDTMQTANFGSANASNNMVAVTGVSSSNYGVNGVSTSGAGVVGTSSSAPGVKGISTSSIGVSGVSSTGFSGFFQTGNSSNASTTLVTEQVAGQTSDLFAAMNSSGTPLARIASTGAMTVTSTSTNPAITTNGAIVSNQFTVSSGSNIDFSKGNVALLTSAVAATTSWQLTNMLAGGSYTIIINDTGNHTYSFNAAGSNCTTESFQPANGATTAGTLGYSVYTILYANNSGGICLISWISGF